MFRLEKVPNQSAISHMLRNPTELMERSENFKRSRAVAATRVNSPLARWGGEQNSKGVALNCEILIFKAHLLLEEAILHLAEEEQLTFKFFKG